MFVVLVIVTKQDFHRLKDTHRTWFITNNCFSSGIVRVYLLYKIVNMLPKNVVSPPQHDSYPSTVV